MRSLTSGQAGAKRGACPRKRMIPLKENPPPGHLYKDHPKGSERLALQAEHTLYKTNSTGRVTDLSIYLSSLCPESTLQSNRLYWFLCEPGPAFNTQQYQGGSFQHSVR